MRRSKLLPAAHTGKVRHHRHTSYGALILLLVLAMGVVIAASHSIVAAADATDPVTSNESVYAVVPGAVPTTAPAITNISQGQTFNTSDPIPANGTCPVSTVVKIFKNDVFAGAALCQNGRFSLSINLFPGTNSLTAVAYNLNDIPGPASSPIVVRDTIAGISSAGLGFGASAMGQFFITSNKYYQGVDVGKELAWTLTISGGQAPYAVNIGWGDGKTSLISRGSIEPFTIDHVYSRPGDGLQHSRNITIQATDQVGEQSFIQLVAVVNGTNPSVVSSIKGGYNLSRPVRIAWQSLLAAMLLCLAFWLGERREAVVLKRPRRA